MAYDRQFLYLEWLFTALGSDEIAATGVHCTGTAPFDAVAALTQLTLTDLEDLANTYATLMTSGSLGWCNFSQLNGIKVSARGTDGLYLAPAVLQDATAAGLVGTSGIGSIQDTIVLSLRTAPGVGRARYGRMYLPHTFIGRVTGTPFMTQATCATLATAGATFIGEINTILASHAVDSNVAIMSSVGSGVTKAVTNVGVGNVLDTQRRRRNKLSETYSFDTV